ncbi:MAG: hypothetical protein AVDCRST_MAG85-3493 [uncultured Solirubrobacteraceae bacterium]|uniref:TIGR02611 family protein n=1 Tax=uncultured Solirubrobacteraceae bacterium TaxID=1162706 RepID=A0A6J4TPY3_9ACTN|nr:MAG: hypothetical protein AVDCRST_MAG85-3493 [uncultured Solirubrobacteraceae bacterium]
MTTDAPEEQRTRSEPKMVTRLRAQREQHRDRSRIVRILFVLVGFTLLLAGIAMLVAPGPAFVVIPIGLAILSLEFTWAETALEKSLEQADRAARKASETTTTERVLVGVATALACAALAAWAYWGDIPVLPV